MAKVQLYLCHLDGNIHFKNDGIFLQSIRVLLVNCFMKTCEIRKKNLKHKNQNTILRLIMQNICAKKSYLIPPSLDELHDEYSQTNCYAKQVE